MIAKPWNNGKHLPAGAGYGLRIKKADRDRYFQPKWQTVSIILDGMSDRIEITLTPSFWRKCHELRSQAIGQWLIKNGYAPWPNGKPPKCKLEPIDEDTFKLSCLRSSSVAKK